jgi:hypothetical protein
MPYFITTRGYKRRFIPVEKCELDGLDEETRSNTYVMRNVLAAARKDPT